MTITAPPTTTDIDPILNELEILGVPWVSLENLTADQVRDLWAVIEQVSPEERPAFAAYMSSDLDTVTDATVAHFRAHYVGTFTTVHDFVRSYARVRWFNPMASADVYAAFTNNLESVLDWIDYDRLTEALFHENRSPYFLAVGMGADHIFITDESHPVEPRVSF